MATRRLSGGLRQLFGLQTKSLDARALSHSRRYTVPGQPYHADWNTDRAVREGFQYNPYVFRAVQVIAQNELARRIRLRKDDPDTGPILAREEQNRSHSRLLHVFNRQANPWEVAPLFRHRLIAQYLLSSRGVFVEAIRTRSNNLWGLLLNDPDLVEIVPTYERDQRTGRKLVANPIGAFRIRRQALVNDQVSAFTEDLPPWDPNADAETQPSGIVWIRSPHPTLLNRGMSPIEAAGLSVDLDKHARLYNRRFLEQDGRPGGILAVKGNTSAETQQVLQSRFQGGPEVAGRTTVIEADDMFWQDTSSTPRDTQWGDTMDRMRREISIAFGVPESVLGDASGRTFDNADAEYAGFWEHTMLPLLRMLDAQLDVLTPGGYRDDLYMQHDVSDVYVLGRHRRAEQDRVMAQHQAGYRTIDDVREALEEEPWNVPATRTLHVPSGKIIVDDGERAHDGDADAVAALPMMGTPQEVDPAEAARQGAEEGSQLGARLAENNVASWRTLNQTDRRDLTAAGTPEIKKLTGPVTVPGWQVGERDEQEGEQSRAHPVPAAQWR